MLFEITFINKQNIYKKFITSGEDETKCMELAKKYIKKEGGAIGKARMSRLKKLPN